MNERAEIWQGMEVHGRVSVMDGACKGESQMDRMWTK